MVPDQSQDTTSEWLERTLMLAGVAMFFTALFITGPLTDVFGVLDDSPLGETEHDELDSQAGISPKSTLAISSWVSYVISGVLFGAPRSWWNAGGRSSPTTQAPRERGA